METLSLATTSFVSELQRQTEIMGCILVGSKSSGLADERSDDDIEVIMMEDAFRQYPLKACIEQYYEERGNTSQILVYDARYMPFSHLQTKCASLLDTDRWPYEHAKLLFDRTGAIEHAVHALKTMDPTVRSKRMQYATLSTSIAIGKAMKAFQRGYEASGRLTLARGAKTLAQLLFALEWRWVPPDHWLEKSLATLTDEAQVGSLLLDALKTHNPLVLREALHRLEHTYSPQEVPRREERAVLYRTMMHPSFHTERLLYMML